MLLEPDSLLIASIWLAVVAALVSFAGLLVGLFSFTSGKDHWPAALLRVRRRVPATPEDHRMNGLGLMLNAAAMMPILLGIGLVDLGSQVRFGLGPEKDLLFLLQLIGLGASLALIAAAYRTSRSVQYTYGKPPAQPGQETPAK